MWLLTSPRINDGAAITIICCTNIHLSNTPWRSLYSSPVIIINSSPFASVARLSAAAACSAPTLTRWAGRRGAAGRSHSSWEHTSPPSPRSLKSEQGITTRYYHYLIIIIIALKAQKQSCRSIQQPTHAHFCTIVAARCCGDKNSRVLPELDFDFAGEKWSPATESEGGVTRGSEWRLSPPEAELDTVLPVWVG